SYLTPLALCGHPAVYDMSHPEERIELEESLPELLITEDPGGFRIDISHRSQFAKLSIETVSATRYRVVNLSSRAVDLAKRLPPGGLVVPREAKDRLLALLGRQSPFVTLRAEIAASDLPAEEGRPAPVLQLSPFAEGLSVTAGVRPFGPDGPFFHTARGGRLVTAQSEGTTRHARRDPARESALLETLLAEHLP
ncbi:swf/snf family helicase, partial [mine drainage metagenome]